MEIRDGGGGFWTGDFSFMTDNAIYYDREMAAHTVRLDYPFITFLYRTWTGHRLGWGAADWHYGRGF